jgi:hypothetical protein
VANVTSPDLIFLVFGEYAKIESHKLSPNNTTVHKYIEQEFRLLLMSSKLI